ncbi:MAG: hypothetical protein WCI00_04085 [bacterium]
MRMAQYHAANWIGVTRSHCPNALLKNLASDTVVTHSTNQGSSFATSIHVAFPKASLST